MLSASLRVCLSRRLSLGESVREDINISRNHTHIDVTHSNLAKNLIYRIEDPSENGTYINNRRLCKEERHIPEIGQIVNFGHRNRLNHPPDAEIPHPEADFAFIVDMADEDTGSGRKILNIKDLSVRDHSEPLPAATQVMEADSTDNRLLEPSESNNTISSTSTAGPATSGNTATSSTSLSAPPTSSVNGSASNGSLTNPKQMPGTYSSSSPIILLNPPTKAPHDSRFDDSINLKIQKARLARQFSDKLNEQYARLLVQIPALEIHKDAVTELLRVNCCMHTQFSTLDQKLEYFRKQCADNQEMKELAEFCTPVAEFLAAEEEQEKTIEMNDILKKLCERGLPKKDPTPWNPLNSEQHYINWMKSMNMTDKIVEPSTDAARDGQFQVHIPALFSLQNAVQKARFANYGSGQFHFQHYLTPLRRVVDVVPIVGGGVGGSGNGGHAGAYGGAQGHIGVIAHAPGREHIDVDEERHSGSSGSNTDNNFSRRRTNSEESDTVDGFGTDDDDAPQPPQARTDAPEAPENVSPAPESPAPQEATEDAAEEEEMEGEEMESTPTPSPVNVVKEPEIDLRQSTTPRVEAQSTLSAVVSTGLMPLSSPILKKTSDDVTLPFESTPKENTEKVADTLEEVVKKNIKKIKAIAATMTPSSEAPTSSGTTSSTSDASASKKKKTSTSSPKERRMKQLDDASSAESDSEDDGGKKKAKTWRRSMRKATSPMNSREDDEDVDETPKEETRKSRRKPATRRTDGEGTSSSRRKRAADDDGSEKEPQPRKQQRRGKKKNGDDSYDADKEKCGVAKLSHCLCVKLEKKNDLEWVSCSDCNQWFHVYCVRLNNLSYAEEDVFSCCGPNPSPEAVASLAGDVAARLRALKLSRIIQSPERF
ncbi:hypothetical protein B9Z55_027326 [Caenorhabditis nigoni]|uniref:FHA domain-containing protein n=1 Tax=Caenorhabditis nigoni TaxID=1611254 RepID=A0A2G5SFZ0_9PELO|nr:hypothetical protein B9Z55_027326 [Caenorhabditis nigoni]